MVANELNCSLSANMLEHSVVNGRAEAEIPAKRHRLIGDEGDGGASITFGLDEGRAMEVGFIKLFWSTGKLELDDLQQDGVDSHTSESSRGFVVKKASQENWGTVLVTLVQRAP